MELPDWKDVVRTVAPALGAAFGGPLGGIAARTVSEAVLGRAGAEEAEIATAVAAATPEQLVALKQADMVFRQRLKELEVDLDRIAADDRASARERQIKTGDRTPAILAGLVLLGYFGCLAALLSGLAVFPAEYEGLITIALGALTASVVQVMNYYFGSSAGSKAKDQTLNAVVGGSGVPMPMRKP